MKNETKAEKIIRKEIENWSILKPTSMAKSIIKALKEANLISSNTVLSVSVCPDWIHAERVKMNDDKYCPICGEKLQAN